MAADAAPSTNSSGSGGWQGAVKRRSALKQQEGGEGAGGGCAAAAADNDDDAGEELAGDDQGPEATEGGCCRKHLGVLLCGAACLRVLSYASGFCDMRVCSTKACSNAHFRRSGGPGQGFGVLSS